MTNPTPPPKPLSISDAGGIRNFLNLMQNRLKHNGLGADDLELRLRLRVPISRIMEDFNVQSDTTIKNWKKLMEAEKNGGNSQTKDNSQTIEPTEL